MRILRARNLLLIIAVVYAIMTIIFCISELNGVSSRVANMRSIISLAADMSVSQALASDEFFNDNGSTSPDNDKLYAVKGVTSIRTAASPAASTYEMQNIFSMVYGIDTSSAMTAPDMVDAEKEELYKRMFGTKSTSVVQNKDWMTMAVRIKSPMPSLAQYGGNGELPNIARLGLLQGSTFAGGGGSSEWLQGETAKILHDKTKEAVVGVSGHSIKNMTLKQFEESHTSCTNTNKSYYSHYNETSDWLHLFDIAKTYTDSNRKEHTYYLAPTNVGITYLDPYILETAFVSNMDLLMRGELLINGGSLQDGVGIVSNGMNGDAQVPDSDYEDKYFIINNGKFSFVKGELKPYVNEGDVGGWTGGESTNHERVLPKIDYMCLDVKQGMYDANIRTIMFLAVGLEADVYHSDSPEAAYKGWLDSLGIDSNSADPYYVMIARVTFYVDAFTSYNTTIARDLYSMFVRGGANGAISGTSRLYTPDNDGNNDNDLFQMRDIKLPNGAEGNHLGSDADERQGYISGVTNMPYYMYTTYYAVMP